MRNFLIGLLVIGICGIANTSPIPENSTPSFQTVSSSTEKVANEAHSTIAEKKGEKEITPTTPSTTTKLPEHPKSVVKDHSTKGTGATGTTADKKETTTSQSKKEDITVTPSSNKAEIKESTTSSLNHKQEEKETTTTSSSPKVESVHPSATGQKQTTTTKPDSENKEKKTSNNKKQKKTSTAYLDKGKVVIFNGICGPDGCQIEGDIYDELVPLPHLKKQG